MMELESERLVICSDAYIDNGQIAFPPITRTVNIFDLSPHRTEEDAFAIYLKNDRTVKIGQFGFRDDRYAYELSYHTNESYRRNHYMQEAMECFIPWFFENVNVDAIYGIIACGNVASKQLAEKVGFIEAGTHNGGSPVYILKRPEL